MKTKNPRLLLVEDHEDTCDLLMLVLGQENYEVDTTPSVSGALALTSNQHFDLILLDSRLIDGTGIDLCRRIRKTDQLTPILFYSALAYESDKQEALRAGAQSYLVKPVEVPLLCQTVAGMIADSRRAGAASVLNSANCKDSGELTVASIGV